MSHPEQIENKSKERTLFYYMAVNGCSHGKKCIVKHNNIFQHILYVEHCPEDSAINMFNLNQ